MLVLKCVEYCNNSNLFYLYVIDCFVLMYSFVEADSVSLQKEYISRLKQT